MRSKYYSLLFFLVLQANVALFAREVPYIQFENFTYEEGLPDNSIFQVVKDSSAFMWIATAGGLVRYDGANFKTIHHDKDNKNSPLSNDAKVLLVDSENFLWIGTQKSGVSRYDIANNTYLHFDDDDKEGEHTLTDLRILSLMEDSRGNVWIGTEGGLNVWDKITGKITKFVHVPEHSTFTSYPVLCTMEDSAGRIWIGTWGGGLNLLIPNENDFSKSTFKQFKNNPLQKETISDDVVWSLYQDSKNRIWIGTFGDGLNLMIPGLNNTDEQNFTAQFISYKHSVDAPLTLANNDIYSIIEDDDSFLWIGTGAGLSLLDLNSVGLLSYVDSNISHTLPELNFINYAKTTNEASLVADILRNIYIDDTKSCWLSMTGGISKYDKKGIKFTSTLTVSDINQEYGVSAIAIENENKHWLAVSEQGIVEYEVDTKNYTIHRGNKRNNTTLNDQTFVSIMQHSSGNLWIGTNSGLSIFDTKQKAFKNFSLGKSNNTQANYVLEDSRGWMWVASNDGLYRVFNVTKDSLEYQVYRSAPSDNTSTLSHRDVSYLAEDSEGNIWATTWSGLNKITINSNDEVTIKKYFHDPKDPHSLGNHQEMISVKISNGQMWIANGIGLSHYQADIDGFINYDSNNGLSTARIVAMEIDSSEGIWCSTRQGIFSFSNKKKFRYFSQKDGLQGNHFSLRSSFKDKKNIIYFGGETGYTTIDPQGIEYNIDKPKILITGFEVFNEERYFDKPIESMETIKLDHSENYFTIKFSALNYIQSYKNQYAYKLEGFDDDWIYCGKRNFASYTNLNGGEYTFRVIGSNNDGEWNEDGTSIKIIVTPPFWQTWWFWILFIGTIMLVIYLYNKQRIAVIRQRSHELEVFNAKLSTEIEFRESTERRLREREQKLTEAEKQLEKTIEELQRSNKELEQFAYIASHDLQEPLRMVGSFVQLIKRRYADKLDDAGREYIEFTVDGVNRMSDLIKGLLSFSRVGRQNANFESCNLNLVVEKKMLDINRYVKERKAKVIIDHLPEAVFCDATQVGAVFYNLVVNAIKFNRKDKPAVEIKWVEENPKHWLFSVKDNGIGIKSEYKETVFGIFKRLNANNEFKGSGIGLALCRRIVENHEGEIWFESEEGEGTTFFFTILKNLDKKNEINIVHKEAVLVE